MSIPPSLAFPEISDMRRILARRWLMVGVAALAIAGIFAVFLVVARTPQLSAIPVWKEFFQISLVIHVDLSIWIWFLAVISMGWQMLPAGRLELPYARGASLGCFAAGTALMALSPLEGEWLVYKSNYIPMLHNPLFALGLGLVASGTLIGAIMALAVPFRDVKQNPLLLGIYTSAFIVLCSLLAFMGSGIALDGYGLTGLSFYEHLFWAGGHIGQLAFTQMMMVAWLILYSAVRGKQKAGSDGAAGKMHDGGLDAEGFCEEAEPTKQSILAGSASAEASMDCRAKALPTLAETGEGGGDRHASNLTPMPNNTVIMALFLIAIPITVASVYPFIAYDVTDYYFQKFFTWQMNIVGGLAASVLGLVLLCNYVSSLRRQGLKRSELSAESVTVTHKRPNRAYSSALIMSMLLFASGGIISLFIRGENVIIPAHYHGSIVGVTIAFMGLAYAMLPMLAHASVAHSRMAFYTPILLGVGQILHIGGLAVSGGYGVLRKTAGGFDDLEPHVRTALGVMGGGGLLAIIGGLMFVIVMVRGFRQR